MEVVKLVEARIVADLDEPPSQRLAVRRGDPRKEHPRCLQRLQTHRHPLLAVRGRLHESLERRGQHRLRVAGSHAGGRVDNAVLDTAGARTVHRLSLCVFGNFADRRDDRCREHQSADLRALRSHEPVDVDIDRIRDLG